MKFDIPFDRNTFIKQANLSFDLVWKEEIKKNRYRILWGSVGVCLGAIMAMDKNCVGYLIIGLGLHYFISFFNYVSHYKKNKDQYFKLVEKDRDSYENAGRNHFWEFSDEHFGFADHRMEVKLRWSEFKGFRVVENTLFLDIDPTNGYSYILNKEEVKENWDEILEFLKEKIK